MSTRSTKATTQSKTDKLTWIEAKLENTEGTSIDLNKTMRSVTPTVPRISRDILVGLLDVEEVWVVLDKPGNLDNRFTLLFFDLVNSLSGDDET